MFACTISSGESINLSMGLDTCNSNITGFQSTSGGLLALDLALFTALQAVTILVEMANRKKIQLCDDIGSAES